MDSDFALLVPLLGIFCVFGLPILAFVTFRILKHRERIEMIRHGVLPPASFAARDWPQAPGAAGRPVVPPDFNHEMPQIVLRKGITVAFVGLALTIGLSFIGYREGPFGPTIHPGPWLLGGLIPLFVGIAQVVIALLSGATLRPMQPSDTARVNPRAVPPSPPPTFEGSYTYRPTDQQELRPPANPRDV